MCLEGRELDLHDNDWTGSRTSPDSKATLPVLFDPDGLQAGLAASPSAPSAKQDREDEDVNDQHEGDHEGGTIPRGPQVLGCTDTSRSRKVVEHVPEPEQIEEPDVGEGKAPARPDGDESNPRQAHSQRVPDSGLTRERRGELAPHHTRNEQRHAHVAKELGDEQYGERGAPRLATEPWPDEPSRDARIGGQAQQKLQDQELAGLHGFSNGRLRSSLPLTEGRIDEQAPGDREQQRQRSDIAGPGESRR